MFSIIVSFLKVVFFNIKSKNYIMCFEYGVLKEYFVSNTSLLYFKRYSFSMREKGVLFLCQKNRYIFADFHGTLPLILICRIHSRTVIPTYLLNYLTGHFYGQWRWCIRCFSFNLRFRTHEIRSWKTPDAIFLFSFSFSFLDKHF